MIDAVCAVLVLAALAAAAGWGLLRALPGGRSVAPVTRILAGIVALSLALELLAWLGVRWSDGTLLLSALLLLAPAGAALERIAMRHAVGARVEWSAPARGFGWGDGVAVVVIAIYTVLAWSRFATTPDFVYHWGLKGLHFALDRGLDVAFLGGPDAWIYHSDYPLGPSLLFAFTAILAAGWQEGALMLWSALELALLALAARAVLSGIERTSAQLALAAVVAGAAAFGLGGQVAGGADWRIALALVAALPALLERPSPGRRLDAGIAAAFAASSKLEGMALALFIVVAMLVRERREWWRARTLLPIAAPAGAVVALWWLIVQRFALAQPQHLPRLDLGRVPVVLAAAVESFATAAWHGLSWSVLLLPLLALRRELRAAALVALVQLAFYFAVYVAAPTDARFHVLSSLPRLLLHLVPATLVLLARAVAPAPAEPAEPAREERADWTGSGPIIDVPSRSDRSLALPAPSD